MKQVYLAGPDVFRTNAIQHGEVLKKICSDKGLEGLYPFDNEVDMVDREPSEIAHEICQANMNMIESCNVVIANLESFRGPSADIGTVFEVAYALGCNKTVIGYRSETKTYKQKVNESVKDLKNYPGVEDFGLVDNLMLDCNIRIVASFEDAVNLFIEENGV